MNAKLAGRGATSKPCTECSAAWRVRMLDVVRVPGACARAAVELTFTLFDQDGRRHVVGAPRRFENDFTMYPETDLDPRSCESYLDPPP